MTFLSGFSPLRANARAICNTGGDAGCVIVRTVVYLIVRQRFVYAQVVEVSAYNDIFIAALAGNVCQHIIHFQRTVRALFQYGNGVGVYLPASALLPFLGVCSKGW